MHISVITFLYNRPQGFSVITLTQYDNTVNRCFIIPKKKFKHKYTATPFSLCLNSTKVKTFKNRISTVKMKLKDFLKTFSVNSRTQNWKNLRKWHGCCFVRHYYLFKINTDNSLNNIQVLSAHMKTEISFWLKMER
jgi:hypothetical protein